MSSRAPPRLPSAWCGATLTLMRCAGRHRSWDCCLPQPPRRRAQVAQVRLAYDTYAAGIEVMQMQRIHRPRPVELPHRPRLPHHGTGRPALSRAPDQHGARRLGGRTCERRSEFFGEGVWRDRPRRTLIGYAHGLPQIKDLSSAAGERARAGAAGAAASHHGYAERTCPADAQGPAGRHRARPRCAPTMAAACSKSSPTRAGRSGSSRPAARSSAGQTLRCDFEGRELAGFLFGQDDPEHRTPLHGSAWLAPVLPGAPVPAGAHRLPDALVRLGDDVSDRCDRASRARRDPGRRPAQSAKLISHRPRLSGAVVAQRTGRRRIRRTTSASNGFCCRPRRLCGEPCLTWALAIFGEAELWSVEYNVIHDTGVERGAIDSGGKAWIVANMLLIGMSAGGDVG